MAIRTIFCPAGRFELPALGLAQSTPSNRLYGSVDLAVTTAHTRAPGLGNSVSMASGVLRSSPFGQLGF